MGTLLNHYDTIKSSAEVDLHNPGLLPAFQCTKVHHRYPNLSDKQTGWLECTTVFHKSSETNRHQTLKHLGQYWCYGNWSAIGNYDLHQNYLCPISMFFSYV